MTLPSAYTDGQSGHLTDHTTIAASLNATVYQFVSALTGSDSNNGWSPGSPKATVTAAIAALGSTGGTVIVANGTYIETITLPAYPKVVNLLAQSDRGVIYQAPAINTPAIQCAASAVQLGLITGTVQPHASGTTGGLVLMDGMRHMTLRLNYIDNGTGGCARIFDARASVTTCYRNTIVPTCVSQAHAARVVFCGNAGTSGTNPNICEIVDPFVYANANMTTVFDLGDSTDWTVDGGLVEANTGAVAVIFGNATKVRAGWFEANAATDFTMDVTRSVAPQNCTVEGTYHSGSALTIPTGVYGFLARYAGTFTITDTDGWKLNRVESAGVGTGPSPWTSKVPVHTQVLLQLAATGQVATVGTWGAPQQGTNMLVRSNSSNANGDAITFGTQLPKGTYSVDLVANKGADAAILALWIDGVDTGKTFDFYAASASIGLLSATAIAISDGYHTVQLVVTGRNASNTTGYMARLGSMTFTRTA